MVEFRDDFNRHSESLRRDAATADRGDLYAAMSDLNIGRQRKHIPGDGTIDPATGKRRKSASDSMLETLEWLLANDAIYRQAHEELIRVLRGAQQTADTALETMMKALAQVENMRDDLLSRAARLPDGRAVFKDKDGKARFEDGSFASQELAEAIQWKDGQTSYKDIEAVNRSAAELKASMDEIRGIQTELGEIHERNTRNDDPLSLEDKEDDMGRVNALGERVKGIEAKVFENNPDHSKQNVTEAEYQNSATISELGKKPDIRFGQ